MSLSLHEVFSICDKRVQFIDDENLVFRAGNTIVLFNVITKHKSVIAFDRGQSVDCFEVIARNPARLAVATHGLRTEILIYDYPSKTPTVVLKEPSKLCFGIMAADRDGKKLATVSKFGNSHLTIWDLATGEPSLESVVADDFTYMSFNPFNPNQLCLGHAKRLTIWNVVTVNAYTNPYLQCHEVSIDMSNKVERQILSHTWIADNKLVCSSPTGELLLCDIAKHLEDLERNKESAGSDGADAFMAAQRRSVTQNISSTSAPVGAGGQAQLRALDAIDGLEDQVSGSRAHYTWQDDQEEEKIMLSVIASRLPFAQDDETAEEVPAENVKQGRWSKNKGAVVYAMTVTKDYLLAGTEDGSVLWLSWDTFRVARVQRLRGRNASAVCALSFAPSYKCFVALGMNGALNMSVVDPEIGIESTENNAIHTFSLGTLTLAVGIRTGEPVGCRAAMLPQLSTDFNNGMRLVTYNDNGVLSLWAVASKQLICSYPFQAQIMSVSTSPDGLLLAVGLSSGVLAVLDASSPLSLRMVYAVRFHKTAVKKVAFSAEGDVLASVSNEQVYFLRPTDFKVLGRVDLVPLLRTDGGPKKVGKAKEGKDELASDDDEEDEEDDVEEDDDNDVPVDGVKDMTWLGHSAPDSKFQRMVISTEGCKALVFQCPNSYFEDADSTLRVMPSHSQTKITLLSAVAVSMVANNRERNSFLALTDAKTLVRYTVAPDGVCVVEHEAATHDKTPSQVALSPNGVVATTATDGNVEVRALATLQVLTSVPCHDWAQGGGRSVVFTDDCRHLVSTGGEGGIFVWDVSTVSGDERTQIPVKTTLSVREKVLEGLSTITEPKGDIPLFNPVMYSDVDMAPGGGGMEVGDSRQKVMREQLLKNIDRFKGQFNEVLKRNEEAPEAERLGLLEFAVDVELRDQLIAEGKDRTEKMRGDLSMAFKGKEIIAQRIKEQCWDSMEVNGEMFRAFKTGTEITNFPIRRRTAEQSKKVKQIEFLRRMQIKEHHFIFEEAAEQFGQTDNRFFPETLTQDAEYLIKLSAPVGEDQKTEEEKAAEAVEKKASEEKKGGKASEEKSIFPPYLLHHPLECVTENRKRIQAALLSTKIEDLKRNFNDLFKKSYGLKQIEIENIMEKNKRIKEIQEELKIGVDVYEASISEDEISKSVLSVKDAEIKSVRVLTKEEQAEYDKTVEAERIKALNKDDGPERALDDFMGGTLETKREISLLDQIVTREEWMDDDPEDFTDEQRAELAQYTKKCSELEEEKENRRKLLQTELVKLKNDVAEVYRSFDAETKRVLDIRVRVLQELYQLELMIIRIINDLGKQEKQQEEGTAIQRRLVLLRREQKIAQARADEFLSKFDLAGQAYEELMNEERLADKNFRKEFLDASEHIDLLLKLFRASKRTAQAALPKKAKEAGAPVEGADKSTAAAANAKTKPKKEEEGAAANLAASTNQAMAALAALQAEPEEEEVVEEKTLNPFEAMEENKQAENPVPDVGPIPEEMDPEIWERFLGKIRAYSQLETRVHKAGEVHEQMNNHLIALQSACTAITDEISALESRHSEVQENRARLELNTEVMVKTLQGMVEIEEAPVVTDLKDCEMIDQSIVEQLNKLIRASGKEKVDILKDIMVSRSAITLLKWTKKKLSLEHKDAVDLTTELQLLRVTKSLQSLIKMGGHDNQKAAELKRLDRKIEFLNHATREKTLGKKLTLMQVKKKIRQQNRENDRLLLTVQELEGAVRERVQISNIRDGDAGDDRKAADRRMKALVTRRKLVDLAKLQAEEIKFLRDQVEGLRKRTFASFAVPRVPANPDETRHENYPRDYARSSSSMAAGRPNSRSRPKSKGGFGGSRGNSADRAVTR